MLCCLVFLPGVGGLVVSPHALFSVFERLRLRRGLEPVGDELRGWSYHEPPVRPRGAGLELGVSEVVYGVCPTRRDLWLRRVQRVEPGAGDGARLGTLVHRLFEEAARRAAVLYYGGVRGSEIAAVLSGEARGVAERLVGEVYGGVGDGVSGLVDAAAELYRGFGLRWGVWVEESGLPPWPVEVVVDGRLVGLSRRLRVDALAPFAVVEVKLGRRARWEYGVALAGYALALESLMGVPVDYGLVVLVQEDLRGFSVEPVFLGEDVRLEFLRRRDEAAEVLLAGGDPGRPPRCPRECPFYRVCNPGGGGGGASG